MQRNRFLLVLIALLGASVAAFWFQEAGGRREAIEEPLGPLRGAGRPEPTKEMDPPSPREDAAKKLQEAERQAATLEFDHDFDVPIQWGGSATLEGQIGSNGSSGVGTLTFVAGTNEGRVILTNRDGSFRAEGLVSGLQWVGIRRAGMPDGLRAVRLNAQRVFRLDYVPMLPHPYQGFVVDSKGMSIIGGQGRFDGQPIQTDGTGRYEVVRRTSGRPLVELTSEGYETVICEIRDEKPQPPHTGRFTLQREALLEVTVQADGPLAEGSIRVEVVPQGRPNMIPGAHATYRPLFIERIKPSQLGSMLLFDSLPSGEVRVLASHPEGVSEVCQVQLTPGRTSGVEVLIEREPAVIGQVLRRGRPVPGVCVQIVTEFPKRLLGSRLGSYRDRPLPLPVQARREAITDSQGRYRLGAFEVGHQRILRVLNDRGEPVASRRIDAGVLELDVHVP